jgi:catechol 2,3-dioxygenase
VIEQVEIQRKEGKDFHYYCSGKNKQMEYKAPAQTKIGHVHLKVADIDRSLGFYRDLLGFEITQHYGSSAVFLSAGGYHHHIGLNTWQSKNAGPAPVNTAGLYHLAILYPTRKDLAEVLMRLVEAKYPLTGASDHGVSEALYMNDPDGNGVELYWDRPKEEWPLDADGNLNMVTEALDLEGLLGELA